MLSSPFLQTSFVEYVGLHTSVTITDRCQQYCPYNPAYYEEPAITHFCTSDGILQQALHSYVIHYKKSETSQYKANAMMIWYVYKNNHITYLIS